MITESMPIVILYHDLPRYDPMINLVFIPSSAEIHQLVVVMLVSFPFQLLAYLFAIMVTFLILILYP